MDDKSPGLDDEPRGLGNKSSGLDDQSPAVGDESDFTEVTPLSIIAYHGAIWNQSAQLTNLKRKKRCWLVAPKLVFTLNVSPLPVTWLPSGIQFGEDKPSVYSS